MASFSFLNLKSNCPRTCNIKHLNLFRCMLRGFRLHKCPYWIRPSITVSDHNGMIWSNMYFFIIVIMNWRKFVKFSSSFSKGFCV